MRKTYPAALFSLLVITISSCQKSPADEEPVVAGFTYTSSRLLPATVHFVNTSTSPGGPSTFSWQFGDGNTATVTDPVHIYTQSGTYMVELIQIPASGPRDTVRSILTISTISGPSGSSNRPHDSQFANFSYSITYSGYAFTFVNTSANADSYVWNFGDATTSASAADTVIHAYPLSGSYHVSLSAANSSSVDTCGATISF